MSQVIIRKYSLFMEEGGSSISARKLLETLLWRLLLKPLSQEHGGHFHRKQDSSTGGRTPLQVSSAAAAERDTRQSRNSNAHLASSPLRAEVSSAAPTRADEKAGVACAHELRWPTPAPAHSQPHAPRRSYPRQRACMSGVLSRAPDSDPRGRHPAAGRPVTRRRGCCGVAEG